MGADGGICYFRLRLDFEKDARDLIFWPLLHFDDRYENWEVAREIKDCVLISTYGSFQKRSLYDLREIIDHLNGVDDEYKENTFEYVLLDAYTKHPVERLQWPGLDILEEVLLDTYLGWCGNYTEENFLYEWSEIEDPSGILKMKIKDWLEIIEAYIDTNSFISNETWT